MLVWDGWEYVERANMTGIVGIIAVTDDKKLVLVEQFRPAVNAKTIELPAGLSGDGKDEDGESFEVAARRELFEETGYECGDMVPLMDGATSPGLTNETVVVYLAKSLRKTGPGGGEGSEDITVHEVPLDNVVEWLEKRKKDGCVIDLKLYSALYFCNGMRPYGNGKRTG